MVWPILSQINYWEKKVGGREEGRERKAHYFGDRKENGEGVGGP